MNNSLIYKIRINQLGYYPGGVKIFAAVDTLCDSFSVLNQRGETVYTGPLVERGLWKVSGESVKTGDFTSLSKPGIYTIFIEGLIPTNPFEIRNDLYHDAAKAALKTYYFQRNTDIEEAFAGDYARKGGHPDHSCAFHSSTGYTQGFLNSPGGWYDAGDYGKYIVNASISVGTMLALYEILPQAFPDDSLNIPESGNGVSDLLSEMRFELDWMATMQDKDGGVFHKITSFVHDDFTMPVDTPAERLVIGKSTAASLDFAAVFAQASRIWADIDPVFSRDALQAAQKAWAWSMVHREEYFVNPDGCNTGPYGDIILDEEFFWAAAELYAATGEKKYYDEISADLGHIQFRISESWRNYVDNLGYYSLLAADNVSDRDKQTIKTGLINLADRLIEKSENNPYGIPLDEFYWGSNSDFLNIAVIFAMAHHVTGDQKYLNKAIMTVDYIFGKNAVGYSFMTGFGTNPARHPHHRLFIANPEPFPGFIVGGPNPNMEDRGVLEQKGLSYPSELPAKAYIDSVESFASNEICINWNAPGVFILAYLDYFLG